MGTAECRVQAAAAPSPSSEFNIMTTKCELQQFNKRIRKWELQAAAAPSPSSEFNIMTTKCKLQQLNKRIRKWELQAAAPSPSSGFEQLGLCIIEQ